MQALMPGTVIQPTIVLMQMQTVTGMTVQTTRLVPSEKQKLVLKIGIRPEPMITRELQLIEMVMLELEKALRPILGETIRVVR